MGPDSPLPAQTLPANSKRRIFRAYEIRMILVWSLFSIKLHHQILFGTCDFEQGRCAQTSDTAPNCISRICEVMLLKTGVPREAFVRGVYREGGWGLHDHHGLDGSEGGGPHLVLVHQQGYQHCLSHLQTFLHFIATRTSSRGPARCKQLILTTAFLCAMTNSASQHHSLAQVRCLPPHWHAVPDLLA